MKLKLEVLVEVISLFQILLTSNNKAVTSHEKLCTFLSACLAYLLKYLSERKMFETEN